MLMKINETLNLQLDDVQCKSLLNTACQTCPPQTLYTQSKGVQTYLQPRASSRITNLSYDYDREGNETTVNMPGLVLDQCCTPFEEEIDTTARQVGE